MNLTILTQYYPPEIGAPQRRLLSLATTARERDHQVQVFTALPSYPTGRVYPGYPKNRTVTEHHESVEVIRTPIIPLRSGSSIFRAFHYGSFVATSGARLVRERRFNRRHGIVVAESPPPTVGLLGIWAAYLLKAPLVLNISDLWPDSVKELQPSTPKVLLRLLAAMSHRAYSTAAGIACQSQEIVDRISTRTSRDDLFLARNGVDLRWFDSAPDLGTAAKRDAAEPIKFVYAGLHGQAQGLAHVIGSFRRFLQDYPEHSHAQLVLVGDGPEKERLRRAARTCPPHAVLFSDPVTSDAVPALLRNADVVLVPLVQRLTGAIPSKLFEGMAAERPILAVGDGEFASIVNGTGCGMVVPPGDSAKLAAAIAALAGDRQLRVALGRRGRLAAETDYDRRVLTKDYLDYLEEVACRALAAGPGA